MSSLLGPAVLLAALALAFANGANDNAKGVATLVGARRLSVARGLGFATAATFLGSLAAVPLAGGLLVRFGGRGIVAPQLAETPELALAVGMGAGATVLAATRLGLPVSTTHALVGALAGVGLVSGTLDWRALGAAFVLPLLLSPLVALLASAALYPPLRRLRLRLGVSHRSCVCLTAPPVVADAAAAAPGSAPAAAAAPTPATAAGGLRLVHDRIERCSGYGGAIAGVSAQRLLDGCHLATAGAVSFARGLNDAPKIAALVLVVAPLAGGLGVTAAGAGAGAGAATVAVAVAMALGGLLAARRVAATMSFAITPMNDGQAFTANLTTAALVLVASRFGLPVSTTHVSVGAITGIGALAGAARWRTLGAIGLSWAAVLPLAALLAALCWIAAR
jgi:PiT family inorganic phosphate transporter